jgi:hypothetical protein
MEIDSGHSLGMIAQIHALALNRGRMASRGDAEIAEDGDWEILSASLRLCARFSLFRKADGGSWRP